MLGSGVKPSAYAEHLLDVATRLSPAKWTQACGLAMARKSSLEGRLRAVLNKKRNRRSVSATLGSVTLIAGVGIAVPLAMLRATDDALAEAAAVVTDVSEPSDAGAEGDSPEESDADDAMPSDTTAAVLLKRWQALEERKSPISEASVARLRAAIDKWVKQPQAKADAAQVLALRDRNIDRSEHPTFEVAGWLSAIASINRGPLQFAINGETRIGAALSEDRQGALKFGPVAETGLRAAWSRYPDRNTYVVGDVVTSAVFIQNASDKTVEFTCPYSVDSLVRWRVTSLDGRKIPAKTSSLRGSTPIFTWRLKPGEATSIGGRSVAIGVGPRREKFDNVHITTVLDVKAGEDVTVRWDVREPVEMVTGDVSFKIVAPEDVPVWSTRRAGDWHLAGGVTMEVEQRLVHAADVSSTAVLTWPQDKDGGTARYKIWLAGDAVANREPWLLAWERDATVLWTLKGKMQSFRDFPSVLATPSVIRRIDFSDPERITETTWRGLPEVLPDLIREKLTEGFLPMKAAPAGSARRQPGHRIFRAEDVRPVTNLLSGKWIAQIGDVKLSVTFEAGTNSVRWVAPNPRAPGAEPIVETLTRLQSAGEDSVRLIRDGNSPAGRRAKLVARLQRGIGDTLLLRVFDRAAFSKDVDTSGIVLHRALAIADNVRPTVASTSAARPAVELKLEDRFAQTLFKIWQANARSDGKIPGGLIGRLGEMVEFFNQFNKDEVKELVAKFEAMLPRFDATGDWSQADAVALLDDVAAVNSIPLLNTSNIAEQRVILTGEPLPPELVDAPWGAPADNGLRVTWHLSPRAKEYRLGTSLKSRILVHNSGEETVIFSMPSWQQSSSHTAHDDGDKAIKVSSTEWTMMASMKVVRLAPGAYYETPAPGIGVGPRTEDEDWAHIRPGAWIEAKNGDDVRLTPGRIEVRSSPRAFATSSVDGRPTSTDSKDAVEFWDRIVTERLDREMPLPTGAADREQLLRRVVRDLFGVEPAQGEIDAYVADKSPGAVHPIAGRDLLKIRVQQGRKLSPFTGTLPSGDIAFRVLAADPGAANRPRVATGPGYYNIADKRRLTISQSRNGNRRINSATIQFHRQYYYSEKGKPAPGPHAISLPEGRLTYAIVWDRDATELWVTQKGLTRRYDFSDPYEIKETQFKSDINSNIPERFRKVVKAALNLPDAPVQERESQKTSGVKLPAGFEERLQWGQPVNGLRAAIVRPPLLGLAQAGQSKDFHLVLQNVAEKSIHLVANSEAPNPRKLTVRSRAHGWTMFRTVSEQPTDADFHLRPREVVMVPIVPNRLGNEPLNSISRNLDLIFLGEMEIADAPVGAWTGKVVTAEMHAAAAGRGLVPKNKDAWKLFDIWNAGCRWDEAIPGGRIGQLAERMKYLTNYQPGHATTPALLKLLSRLDATRDWSGQEAILLLDELAEVNPEPIQFLLKSEVERNIRRGKPLPNELANAPWGEAQSNGLRVAWLLEPQADEYRRWTPLKCRVLFHNSGKDTVVFRTPLWRHGVHTARNAKGENIRIASPLSYPQSQPLVPFRLQSGEFIEVEASNIGVGPNDRPKHWQSHNVSLWLQAKDGDEVTFIPQNVLAHSMSDSLFNGGGGWWSNYISGRLNLEKPLPSDDEVRRRMLYRVMKDLFGKVPTDKDYAEFLSDKKSDAMESLARRLLLQAGVKPFAGSLQSGPTRFRVLPAVTSVDN